MLMTFYRVLYFPKNVPNNVGFVNIFDKKYEKQLTSLVDNWSNLYFSLNAQTESKILNLKETHFDTSHFPLPPLVA